MKSFFKMLVAFAALCMFENASAQFYPHHSGPITVNKLQPNITLNSGQIADLKGVTKVNIVYDYSNMSVGEYKNEEEYINKKTEEYNKKDPAKAEKFKASWYDSRTNRFEPKFQDLFNKTIAKTGMVGVNYATDADITLKVATVLTEPGFNVGVVKRPAYIDLECTFIDKSGKEIVRYFIKNSPGAQAMGFDYDTGTRLAECYAKAGKMLAKDVSKKLKKVKS